MRIQHNIAALNSYRQLGSNNNAVAKNLEKLSSGFRINRAGDDAAGLAISEKMRAQVTGLETAQKNAQDGISLVQTTEGALTEVHSMLNRMVELADQSANGIYDNNVDRNNLQKEMNSLKSEIDRISEGTNFNGINLLDGSLAGKSSSIAKFSGAATAATAGADASTGTNFALSDTVNIDGTDIKIDWNQLNTAEKASLQKNWAATTSAPTAADAKTAAAAMQKAINASIDKHNQENGTSLQNIKVEAGGTDTTGKTFAFTSGLNEGTSKISISTDATAGSVLTQIFGPNSNIKSAAPQASLNFSAMDLNNQKFTMKIGGEQVEVAFGNNAFTATSTVDNVITALNTSIGTALTNYDTAQGNAANTSDGMVSARLGQDGTIEIINTSGKDVTFADKGGANAATLLGLSEEGRSSGGLNLQIGDTGASFNQLNVKVNSMSTNALGLSNVSISTQASAKSALDTIKSAINSVSSTRGDLGSIQNRLEHTVNNLSVTSENMTAAESRIRDTDMASEMMAYTKNNILVQASQAMLAQANQMPQGVLQLLK